MAVAARSIDVLQEWAANEERVVVVRCDVRDPETTASPRSMPRSMSWEASTAWSTHLDSLSSPVWRRPRLSIGR